MANVPTTTLKGQSTANCQPLLCQECDCGKSGLYQDVQVPLPILWGGAPLLHREGKSCRRAHGTGTPEPAHYIESFVRVKERARKLTLCNMSHIDMYNWCFLGSWNSFILIKIKYYSV